ncbi:MAG: hypothetical protein IPP33_06165 [Flavobacteriales bacterium]|nr:hypothetical protein [Flavobacteriales bacterium]
MSYPEVPDKKVYPVRWLIVLVSVLSASLLCFLLVVLREPALLGREQHSGVLMVRILRDHWIPIARVLFLLVNGVLLANEFPWLLLLPVGRTGCLGAHCRS